MSEEVTGNKARKTIGGRGSTDQAADMDDRRIELEQHNHKLRELLLKQAQDRARESLESPRAPEGAVSMTPPCLCSSCWETQQIPDQAADVDRRKDFKQINHKMREWLLKQLQDRVRQSLESPRAPEGAVSMTPSLCSNCRETQEVLKLSMNFGEELHHNLKRAELNLHEEQTLRKEDLAEKMRLLCHNLELKFELESSPVKKDIPCQQKQLENRILELEAELEEERDNVQMLTENAERRKEQIKKMRELVAGIEDSRRPSFEDSLARLQGRTDKLELRLKADDGEQEKLRATNRRLAKQVEQLSKQIVSERQEADKQKVKMNLKLNMTKQQLVDSELDFDCLDMQLQDVERKLEAQVHTNAFLQTALSDAQNELCRQRMPSLDFPPTEDEDEDDQSVKA